MTENSKIEWTDHTFNPVTGCQKVGPGCDNCYAEGWAKRSGLVKWGPKEARRETSAAYWRQPIKWNREAEAAGVRRRVFCASLADVFDNAWPEGVRERLWALIAATPHLDWLLLTKRPGNIAGMLPPDWGAGYPNVWLGCTVVNQEEADRDIPKLLAVPAAVRFLSMEPLLGPVDLARWLPKEPFYMARCGGCGRVSTSEEWASDEDDCWCNHCYSHDINPLDCSLDWIIVGGESGPHARPMHPDWARQVHDQCAAAGVPMLFKQWGEWAPLNHLPRDHQAHTKSVGELGASLHVFDRKEAAFRVGKKAAGRLLDGVEHNGFPEAHHG